MNRRKSSVYDWDSPSQHWIEWTDISATILILGVSFDGLYTSVKLNMSLIYTDRNVTVLSLKQYWIGEFDNTESLNNSVIIWKRFS